MSKFLSGVGSWFAGKKTILGGILVLGAAAAGAWFGKIDPTTALAIGGMGFAAIGMGDKANRHQAQILTALQGVAQAGADYRAGNVPGALHAVEGTAATWAPIAGASLHLSADSAGELAAAIQNLAGGGAAATTISVPGTVAVGTSAPASSPATKAAIA